VGLRLGEAAVPGQLLLELVVVALELEQALLLDLQALLDQLALSIELAFAAAGALVEPHRDDACERPNGDNRDERAAYIHALLLRPTW
jgi:hypothetical protein